MCNTTCDLIEKRVVPTPEGTPVRFLKAMVGWYKLDSVTELASNHAGVRFLGLATAMMSSMEPLEAAQVLAEMIRETAQDKRLVPTKKQLHDLWMVMTPRCTLSGFTDRVLYWRSQFIDSNTGRLLFCAEPDRARGVSQVGLQRLVEAFREISRIGDASITNVRIQAAYQNLPWLSAFTEWCLGLPPSIIRHDGIIIQDYPDSPVSVSAVEALGHQQPFEITLHYVDNMPGPRQLVMADQNIELGGAVLGGMASLPEYGRYLRRLLGFHPGVSSPPKEMLMSEHPSVKAYFDDMKRSCTCCRCSGTDESFLDAIKMNFTRTFLAS